MSHRNSITSPRGRKWTQIFSHLHAGMSQASRHLMMLIPQRNWKTCSGRRAASVWAAGDLSPGLLGRCVRGQISTCSSAHRALNRGAETKSSSRYNSGPITVSFSLPCKQKEESILVLSYYFIHACFTLHLLALTLELIYIASLSDSALEMSSGISGKRIETRGPGEIMYMV